MKRAAILGSTVLATGLILSACAQQGAQSQQAAAPQPAPTPAPQPKQPSYNLSGGSMTVVTEPAPQPRRTSAALDLVQSKTLLDVARQATVRVAKADAGATSVINAVALPTTDVALGIEQALLGRLGNVFSLAVQVNQVGNPSRAFPFTPEGARELAGQLSDAGLKGYALDARTEFLDLETSGGTISDPVERFSLNGQVHARLIDVADGRVIRQAVCTDNQQMGTLRDIFVAEGKPVPQSAALADVAAPAPAPADAQAAQAAQSDGPKPASETSAAALALIQNTDGSPKSQKLVEPTVPTTRSQNEAEVQETQAAAPVESDDEAVAEEAVAAVSTPQPPTPEPAQPEQTPVAAPSAEPIATPAPTPTAEERVQAALRQAEPTRAELANQQAEEQAAREQPANVPIRRTGAFSGVVQDAIEATPADPLRDRRRTVTVQGTGVKQKVRLVLASLLAAQATAPITYPGPGASGRVSDGAANRLIRKCTEELWQKIVPE